jgi:hypothetical protein
MPTDISLLSVPCRRHCRSGVFRDHPPSVNDPRNPSQDAKQDIDQEVGVAASLEEDGKRRQEDRKEVEADITL